MVKGIKPKELLVEEITNCKGGHCITWSSSHDGYGTVVFRCTRCKKYFVLVQNNTPLETELKKQYMI